MEQQILSPGSTFADLSKKAWHDLSGKWGWCILAGIIAMVILSGAKAIPFLCFVSDILLFPLTAGVILLYLRVARNEPISLEVIFEPFSQYGRMVLGGIVVGALITLVYLLLIIPGIIFFAVVCHDFLRHAGQSAIYSDGSHEGKPCHHVRT